MSFRHVRHTAPYLNRPDRQELLGQKAITQVAERDGTLHACAHRVQQLKEDDAQRVDVDRLAVPARLELLRGAVLRPGKENGDEGAGELGRVPIRV